MLFAHGKFARTGTMAFLRSIRTAVVLAMGGEIIFMLSASTLIGNQKEWPARNDLTAHG
jgi:hypothetical protein